MNYVPSDRLHQHINGTIIRGAHVHSTCVAGSGLSSNAMRDSCSAANRSE
jgi:hypothetical protein